MPGDEERAARPGNGTHPVSFAFVLAAALASAAGPSDAVTAAANDLLAQPIEVRPYLRYLSLYHLEGKGNERWLADWKAVVDFHVNTLSRRQRLQPAVRVTASLLRVNIKDYGWDPKVWEKLAQIEPYFHATLLVEKVTDEQRYHPGGEVNGTYYAPGNYTFRERTKVKKRSAAHWLPTQAAATLAKWCETETPIVRADWFFYQTSIAKDRVAGYYDWLGLGKNAKDFQKLLGGDEDVARAVGREIRGIRGKSGVTLSNRVIVRYGAATGGWWVTYDYKDNDRGRNVIRNLDKDVNPPDGDASEQLGFLPNGLFAWWLQDANGVRQDTAPDFIASDNAATGNDKRVHCAMSCYRCHVEGIRPVGDYARRLYRGKVKLAAVDYEKYVRLVDLYLTDLKRWVDQDTDQYSRSVWELTRMKPGELMRVYGRCWDHYLERDLDAGAVAEELGTTPAHLMLVLRTYATPGKGIPPLDPVLAQLIAEDDDGNPEPIPLRREHLEEAYVNLQDVLLGYRGPPAGKTPPPPKRNEKKE